MLSCLPLCVLCRTVKEESDFSRFWWNILIFSTVHVWWAIVFPEIFCIKGSLALLMANTDAELSSFLCFEHQSLESQCEASSALNSAVLVFPRHLSKDRRGSNILLITFNLQQISFIIPLTLTGKSYITNLVTEQVLVKLTLSQCWCQFHWPSLYSKTKRLCIPQNALDFIHFNRNIPKGYVKLELLYLSFIE